ncbi:MAG: pyridoxine 5'-phosphate synthase, partial [Bdellovibrionota bacterium]
YPALLEAARAADTAGAHQITIHLREDRRHIQDADVKLLRQKLKVAMNFEMAVAEEIVRIAIRTKPAWTCLVPEKRQEVTTEGGLNLVRAGKRIGQVTERLKKAGIQVSHFIEPDPKAVSMAKGLGADAVELHTGRYCALAQAGRAVKGEVSRIRLAALEGWRLGVAVHAGHGFDYENVRPIALLLKEDAVTPLISEYNIGHAVVCRAAIVGMERAVREMLSSIHAP